MASHTVGLIRDQNVNVHYTGASVASKGNMATAPRKGGVGGRKPLGDLSNAIKPMLIQTSKKSVSKASEKVQVSGRKALSDISNSGKPCLKETSKKIQTSKLAILAENPSEPEDIAEEGFLHNHDECIKAQKKDISTSEFLRILGLEDFSKTSASAKGIRMPDEMPMSPSRNVEAKEMIELLVEDWDWGPPKLKLSMKRSEDWGPLKLKLSMKRSSAPPSPEPLGYSIMQWNDPEYELIGSP